MNSQNEHEYTPPKEIMVYTGSLNHVSRYLLYDRCIIYLPHIQSQAADQISYTLTATAKENTRKAVLEVIMEVVKGVRFAITEATELAKMYLEDGDDEEWQKMLGHIEAHTLTASAIEKCLNQYQDPQTSTEASDDKV